MSKKIHRTYSKETEAAWFVIREFIDVNNCSTEFEGSAIQMNFNEALCHLYSKTGIFSPYTYSKRLYDEHLKQFANHYYRSKFRARHSVGYQRTDKQAQKAIFANELGITSKKSTYSPDAQPLYILLLGFDIDGHNGEPDAQGVSEWLRSTYFEQSYWEPSTHFKGRHGYIKLAYPDHIPLDEIKLTLSELFILLDQKRVLMGFKASIDDPCGLPASFYWDNQISVSSPMPKITSKEHSRYRRIREKLERGQLKDPNQYISLNRSYDDIDKIINIPLPCSMKQSQCLKLPRFNHTDPSKANMDDIQYFYNLKFYSYDKVLELLYILRKELHIDSHSKDTTLSTPHNNQQKEPTDKETADFPPLEEGNTALFECIPRKQDLYTIEEMEKESTIVRSPQREHSTQDTHENGPSWLITLGKTKYAKGNKKYKQICEKNIQNLHQYEQRIEQIKSITNRAALTNSFYLHYSNYLGRVPDIQEAQDEYIRLGLNTTQRKDVPNRIQRLTAARQFVLSKWDMSKRGFQLGEWIQMKSNMISQVSVRMEGLNRSWNKDKKKVYEIKIEELALIYYAIGKSNQMDSKKAKSEKNSFSYHQVKECFQLIYQKGCHRAKIARIFKILLEAGLIRLVGHYEVGEFGNKYEAVDIQGSSSPVQNESGS